MKKILAAGVLVSILFFPGPCHAQLNTLLTPEEQEELQARDESSPIITFIAPDEDTAEELQARVKELREGIERRDTGLLFAIGIGCLLLVAFIVESVLIYRLRKKLRDVNITERKEQEIKERWWIGQASLAAGVFLFVMSIMQYQLQRRAYDKEDYAILTGIGAALTVFGITYLLRRIYQKRGKPESGELVKHEEDAESSE